MQSSSIQGVYQAQLRHIPFIIIRTTYKGQQIGKKGRETAYFSSRALKGYSNRDIQELFQHSGSTVTAVMHEICNCVVVNQRALIPAVSTDIHRRIRSNNKFYPYIEIASVLGTVRRLLLSFLLTNNPPGAKGKDTSRRTFLGSSISTCNSYVLGSGPDSWKNVARLSSNLIQP